MEAAWYIINEKGSVTCQLCPHTCIIRPGKSGICKVRLNDNGRLVTLNYGFISSINADPVEKKPLYHFFPGRKVLSIGSAGCNMKCSCCQNWQISQSAPSHIPGGSYFDAQKIVDMAVKLKDNIGVAYTYNEPSVWFEFMMDVSKLVHEGGMKNVVVSNGYINPGPLDELINYTDAFNIDLKAFSDKAYRELTGAGLAPVQNSLRQIKKSGKHLEITNLIIPGVNDNISEFDSMISWIVNELGKDTVLHLSRYYPAYRMDVAPSGADHLIRLFEAASGKLNFVYLGNIYIEGCQDTKCPKCRKKIIRRSGYSIEITGMKPDGTCSYCGEKVAICE